MRRILWSVAWLMLAGCSGSSQSKQAASVPDLFKVNLDTSKGPVVIEVHKDWAPLGAERFYQLVKSGYYDGARFFRVLPGFMAQFGIAADPQTTAKWKDANLQDDPVKQSNTRGMVTFATAGPNTRTTQMFINTGDNARLDSQGIRADWKSHIGTGGGGKLVQRVRRRSAFGSRARSAADRNTGQRLLGKGLSRARLHQESQHSVI